MESPQQIFLVGLGQRDAPVSEQHLGPRVSDPIGKLKPVVFLR